MVSLHLAARAMKSGEAFLGEGIREDFGGWGLAFLRISARISS